VSKTVRSLFSKVLLKRGKRQQTTITITDSRLAKSILNHAFRGLKDGVHLSLNLRLWVQEGFQFLSNIQEPLKHLILSFCQEFCLLNSESVEGILVPEQKCESYRTLCARIVNR